MRQRLHKNEISKPLTTTRHFVVKRFIKYFFASFLSLSFCFSLGAADEPSTQTDTSSSGSDEPGFTSSPDEGSFSSNPGEVNSVIGTGDLGRKMGFDKDSGIRIGGLVIEDYSYLLAGGYFPHKGGGTSVVFLNLALDTEKLKWWKGGLFSATYLRYDGRNINAYAGSIQGYNSLPGLPPLDRNEIYELWFRQDIIKKKFFMRIGQMITTFDFANVIRPVAFKEEHLNLPANTSLTYNPIFIMPTLLGVMPGFYNSAFGVTATYLPTHSSYISYGVYDGNLARGKNTGMRGPQFNGYYFHVAETGFAWSGKKKMHGNIGFGGWYQSGKLTTATDISQRGETGLYIFGSQRLWWQHPGVDSSGLIGFFQGGWNNSRTLQMTRFAGGGLTFYGLVPCRKNDSFGCGASWTKLNKNIFLRYSEMMYQAYYQIVFTPNIFLTTSFSYIPDPGADPTLDAVYAFTSRLIAVF